MCQAWINYKLGNLSKTTIGWIWIFRAIIDYHTVNSCHSALWVNIHYCVFLFCDFADINVDICVAGEEISLFLGGRPRSRTQRGALAAGLPCSPPLPPHVNWPLRMHSLVLMLDWQQCRRVAVGCRSGLVAAAQFSSHFCREERDVCQVEFKYLISCLQVRLAAGRGEIWQNFTEISPSVRLPPRLDIQINLI